MARGLLRAVARYHPPIMPVESPKLTEFDGCDMAIDKGNIDGADQRAGGDVLWRGARRFVVMPRDGKTVHAAVTVRSGVQIRGG